MVDVRGGQFVPTSSFCRRSSDGVRPVILSAISLALSGFVGGLGLPKKAIGPLERAGIALADREAGSTVKAEHDTRSEASTRGEYPSTMIV